MNGQWIEIAKDGLPKLYDYRWYIIYDADSPCSQKMSFAMYDPFISTDPNEVWMSDTFGETKATHYMLAPLDPFGEPQDG